MSPQQAHVAQATDVDQVAINTIRTLAIDAIQKANSGHPGTPMGAAPTAYTLWQQFLRYDPEQPMWPNRDRFVLSSGHASMLLYALIHLAGVKAANPSYEKVGSEAVTLDDIKTFRQEASRCPAIRNTVGRQAWRARRAHWAREFRPALAWRSQAAGWQKPTIALVSSFSISMSTLCAAMAT